MFDRNKSGDYVTREQAESYVADLKRQAQNSFVSQEDAATFTAALNAVEARVQELENLARDLRATQGSQNAQVVGAARRQAESVVSRTDALTKSDAEQALAALKREGAEQFRQLNAKLDESVRSILRTQDYAEAVEAGRDPHETSAQGVDYGAVAFGLSQIKRDVANVVGSEARTADLTAHYVGTVQYFADVFAKSDPSFDIGAFKRQAGV